MPPSRLPPHIHPCRATLALVACALASAGAPAQPQPTSILMLRPSNPGATEERAKGFLEDFAGYLGSGVAAFAKARVQLLAALTAMKQAERGKQLLELIQSSGFAAPDRALLKRTAEAYDRKSDSAGEPAKKNSEARQQ